MVFEWDEEKERLNKKKHGISFEMSARVFRDTKRLELIDLEHSTMEEERVNIIGNAGDFLILFVVCIEKNDNIRIISARKATSKETVKYYENYDTR